MKAVADMSVEEIAGLVCETLDKEGITATLTDVDSDASTGEITKWEYVGHVHHIPEPSALAILAVGRGLRRRLLRPVHGVHGGG